MWHSEGRSRKDQEFEANLGSIELDFRRPFLKVGKKRDESRVYLAM